jgi:hypothetical protein
MPYEQYRALSIRKEEQNKELPNPEYWGIAGMEWGALPGELKKSGAAQHWMIAGLQCRRVLTFEGPSGGLSAVRCHFAEAVPGREERLGQFQALKSRLVKVYNAPTHSLKPDEAFRGKDAYVQGLDKGYSLEWRGPETTISLRLSDEELTLEFRQAPSSQAVAKREAAARGQDFQRRLIKNNGEGGVGSVSSPSAK